jgi:hypothetical protein
MTLNPRQEAELRLIEKAWKDEAFRKALVADPHATVSRELGVKLPSNLTISVVEETANTFVLVIPSRMDAPPSGQLSKAELDTVAGGCDNWSVTTGVACG